MNLKLKQTDYDETFQKFIYFSMTIEHPKNENYMMSKVQPTLQLNLVVHKSKEQTDKYLKLIKRWDDNNCPVVIR